MNKNIPTILVIIGISGDLSKRKLLPAIGQIAKTGMTPDKFKIIGITRQKNIKVNELLKNTANKKYLINNTEIFHMNLDEEKEYKRLENFLKKIDKKWKTKSQYLFYLSIPPKAGESIINLLGKSGISKKENVKLLLEKPFGTDLNSAKILAKHVSSYFKEEQIYRIDHYLAKETAQNIIVFRNGNSLFKRTWNKDFIESINVTVSEDIGIEGRVSFYEQTGALRDFQSHLLQLLALTLMEIPKEGHLDKVPELRYKALKKLKIPTSPSVLNNVKRGQYKGYKEEVNNEKSMVETFASINLESSDKNWEGVKINITTGKSLKNKTSEIKILYRKSGEHESNELLLHLQPDEGISFSVWAKKPGYEHQVSRHALNFSFKDHYPLLPEAYEQVLFNAINGDHSLFTSGKEVIESWRIVDKLQKIWNSSTYDLIIYPKGSSIEDI